MAAGKKQDLEVCRGDTHRFRFTFTQSDGTPADFSLFTSSNFRAEIRESKDAPSAIGAMLFDATNSDIPNSKIVFIIGPALSDLLPRVSYYDIEITNDDGESKTPIYGNIIKKRDVTR